MNDWDKNNLEFLLTLKTEKDWLDWFEATDEDDHIYAMELIKRAQVELLVKAMEIAEDVGDLDEYAEANAVLKKFML